jgi:alkylhydroperoxidase family enzyme
VQLPTNQELLEALHPEGARELGRLYGVARESADPELLELCHVRIASMLGHERTEEWISQPSPGLGDDKLRHINDWRTSDAFTPAERAHLAFTEQFVMSVSDLTAADIDSLLAFEDQNQVYAFITALYVVEMTLRLDMVIRSATEITAFA